jgi:DmsE family decaheme c-type cytochrome
MTHGAARRILPYCFAAFLLTCSLTSAARAKDQASNPTPQTSAALAGNAPAQYVGSDTCKSCHADEYKQIEGSQHWNTNLKGAAGQQWHGCESCHGPGSAHVEGGGDKTKIFVFETATPAQISQRCLGCHSNTHPNFLRSDHFKNDVTCISCHSPHHAQEQDFLLKAKTPELCYGCHNDARVDFNRPFHHRVNEGLIQCSDCHNVHDSRPQQVRLNTTQDQICYKCHAEKRGPFTFEHLPVRTEGCSACHTPHGSNNQRLLRRTDVNNMCIECHGLSTFATLHNQSTKYQACTMCHVAIHGSNFSNYFFK